MSLVVVVSTDRGAKQLLPWGIRIAQAREVDVIVLNVEPTGSARQEALEVACREHPDVRSAPELKSKDPEPKPKDSASHAPEQERPEKQNSAQNTATENTDEAEQQTEQEADTSVAVEVVQLESTQATDVLAALAQHKASIALVGRDQGRGRRSPGQNIAQSVFERAPCSVVMMRLADTEAVECQRILVPTGGGPHADAALSLAAQLRGTCDGKITALNVEPRVGEISKQVGAKVLDRVIQRLGIEPEVVEKKVQLADHVWRGIAREAESSYDLILIGASNTGVIRHALFGSVPDRFISSANQEGSMIAVVREKWPFMDRFRARLERVLDLTIPQLGRDDRVGMFEKLQSGSKWNFDFFALISLSTLIASLGLLQSSAAVVIGAMLVAPLMTPLLGAGLGLVQGNLPLIRTASMAIVLGFVTAVGIGFVAGICVQIPQLTPELLARGGPTLLDLFVAFFSGVAAAYCSGRTNLSAALPGVAIAAALVPPVATIGVSFALHHTANAQGAALLFGTNVVAIILGAAVAFYAGGIRPRKAAEGQPARWVRHTLLVLILIAAVLTIPLASVLISNLAGDPPLGDKPREVIEKQVATWPDHQLVSTRYFENPEERGVEIVVRAPEPVHSSRVRALAEILRQELGAEMKLRLRTELFLELGGQSGK